jgi:hypothetical protein
MPRRWVIVAIVNGATLTLVLSRARAHPQPEEAEPTGTVIYSRPPELTPELARQAQIQQGFKLMKAEETSRPSWGTVAENTVLDFLLLAPAARLIYKQAAGFEDDLSFNPAAYIRSNQSLLNDPNITSLIQRGVFDDSRSVAEFNYDYMMASARDERSAIMAKSKPSQRVATWVFQFSVLIAFGWSFLWTASRRQTSAHHRLESSSTGRARSIGWNRPALKRLFRPTSMIGVFLAVALWLNALGGVAAGFRLINEAGSPWSFLLILFGFFTMLIVPYLGLCTLIWPLVLAWTGYDPSWWMWAAWLAWPATHLLVLGMGAAFPKLAESMWAERWSE